MWFVTLRDLMFYVIFSVSGFADQSHRFLIKDILICTHFKCFKNVFLKSRREQPYFYAFAFINRVLLVFAYSVFFLKHLKGSILCKINFSNIF